MKCKTERITIRMTPEEKEIRLLLRKDGKDPVGYIN